MVWIRIGIGIGAKNVPTLIDSNHQFCSDFFLQLHDSEWRDEWSVVMPNFYGRIVPKGRANIHNTLITSCREISDARFFSCYRYGCHEDFYLGLVLSNLVTRQYHRVNLVLKQSTINWILGSSSCWWTWNYLVQDTFDWALLGPIMSNKGFFLGWSASWVPDVL